jgi:hypothetical protein
MKTKDYTKFTDMLGIYPPKRASETLEAECRNWFLLHPALASLEASTASLETCRAYMYIELNREGGPRHHIMDRLYKRFSNLRRELETSAMAALLPEVELAGE